MCDIAPCVCGNCTKFKTQEKVFTNICGEKITQTRIDAIKQHQRNQAEDDAVKQFGSWDNYQTFFHKKLLKPELIPEDYINISADSESDNKSDSKIHCANPFCDREAEPSLDYCYLCEPGKFKDEFTGDNIMKHTCIQCKVREYIPCKDCRMLCALCIGKNPLQNNSFSDEETINKSYCDGCKTEVELGEFYCTECKWENVKDFTRKVNMESRKRKILVEKEDEDLKQSQETISLKSQESDIQSCETESIGSNISDSMTAIDMFTEFCLWKNGESFYYLKLMNELNRCAPDKLKLLQIINDIKINYGEIAFRAEQIINTYGEVNQFYTSNEEF